MVSSGMFGLRTVLGPLVVLVAVSALSGCSGEEDPVASEDRSAGARATPSAAQSPEESSGTPRASTVPESTVEAPSGIVLERRLKPSGAVEKRDLPSDVSSMQVRGMRNAWNKRGEQLDRMRSEQGDDKVCVARPGDVWLGVFRTDAGRLLVGMGPLDDDGKPRCTVDGAAVLVDSSTRQVLGRGRVALLL